MTNIHGPIRAKAPLMLLGSLLLSSTLLGNLACGGSDEETGQRGQTGFSGSGAGASASGTGGGAGTLGGIGNPIAGTFAGQAGVGVPAGTGVVGGFGGDMCAEANINVSRNTPQITFVIDGSGSMCENFGGSTRWQSLRSALLAPDTGIIHRLQRTAEFGMLLYDGTIDVFLALTAIGGSPNPVCAGNYIEQRAAGECPQLIAVPVAPTNAAAIDMAFPATELGGSTPTDRAMNRAIDDLLAIRPTNPDAMAKPQYVILATDGQPNDICVGGLGGDGAPQRQGVLDTVARGAMNDIKTFVISLAGNDAGLQAHLDEVARRGDPTNAMARTFSPATPDELASALAALVGGAVGCEIVLDGEVAVGQECTGTVTMNGIELPCCQGNVCGGVPTSPADGWILKDPSTIELVGDTCLDFLTIEQASLRAAFPCEVFSPM